MDRHRPELLASSEKREHKKASLKASRENMCVYYTYLRRQIRERSIYHTYRYVSPLDQSLRYLVDIHPIKFGPVINKESEEKNLIGIIITTNNSKGYSNFDTSVLVNPQQGAPTLNYDRLPERK